jgi:peptidoglycan/LPS O-acetylase OafA/YrhL
MHVTRVTCVTRLPSAPRRAAGDFIDDPPMSSLPLPAPGSPRQHGLDTLRAAAILLVFAYHYQVFVSGTPTFGWLSGIGWTGVDLFFVLSGYLIANQLMGGMKRGGRLSLPRDLWAALMQRAKTLLAIGVAASLGMLTLMLHFYYIDDYGYGHAMSSWGYSALAWSFGLMVLAALGLMRGSGRTVPVIAAACLLGGWLLYRRVELPFLALRDRWIPSQFVDASRATTADPRSPQHA